MICNVLFCGMDQLRTESLQGADVWPGADLAKAAG
jgi:hypothetical protein